jgi:MFS family permease
MDSGINSTENKENVENKINMSCGLGNWRPKWLQMFASPKVFLINFSFVAIFQGASFTYLIGSMTTLEKRYGFESKISGFILIADNISQMLINPLIGHLGTKYNRPLIMAIGEMVVALSCFMCAVPYFIYGPNDNILDNRNSSLIGSKNELCDSNRQIICSDSATVWPAVIILWIASFVNGLGYTAFYTVGLPYIDDNTSKKNSPMYLSFTAAIRLLGPSLGFLLSSACLSLYENPFGSLKKPNFLE